MDEKDKKKLTTVAGAPVVDNQNSMTAGPREPMLLQDVWFLEKLAHFDREVIPERRMHVSASCRGDQWKRLLHLIPHHLIEKPTWDKSVIKRK